MKSSDKQVTYKLFDNLPIAVYTCDKEGYITYFNNAAAALWGNAPKIGIDKWGGARQILTVDGEPLDPEDSPVAYAVKNRKAHQSEITIVQPGGDNRIVQSNPTPLYDDEGDFIGVVNTLLDITDQKLSEQKQAMLAAIIESSEDAIVSKTLAGFVTSWNAGAQNLFGYAEHEMIGNHITTLIPEERLQEEVEIISQISQGRRVEHYETYRKHKSGMQIPVSLAISPIKDKSGRIIGASKIARNISRQKAFEDTLQRYAESLETLNAVGKLVSEKLDVEAILQKVTDATTAITGAAFGAFFYNKIDDAGESYTLYTISGVPKEAFAKFGMPRNTDVFAHTFNGVGIVRVDDITKDPRYGRNAPHFGMPAGHLAVVSYLALPVVSKSGTVIGGLFYGHPEPGRFTKEHEKVVEGIATQASIALDNAQLYQEIQKLNDKKDEFIGLASHELKTPITSLNGYLQIINRSLPEGDRNKAFITKALQQINKLSDLISDLLDVSKIEAGKLPLTYGEFDIAHLVADVTELMQYGNKSHVMTVSGLTSLVVEGDKQRLEQVIINLISNGVKYSPQANAVNIKVNKQDNKAIVSVQDFGMGISKEAQERIFSRFYRVEDMAAHISGLGIGLYISHDIITRHGGKFIVQSEPGQGSTFSFEIPLKQ